MDTLQETIRKIAKRGWRVHFEGFGDGNVYLTITTNAAAKPFSYISKAVSRYELDFGKIDILAAKLEHAFETLVRLEENPYGRSPEREATDPEEVYGDLPGRGNPDQFQGPGESCFGG